MNDNNQGTNDSMSFGPVIGFAIGALAGGVVALLLAPASGEKTRRRLKTVARQLGRDARRTFEDAKDTVGDAATGLSVDVKAAIDAGREAFRHDGDARDPRPASRGSRTA